MTTSVKHVKTGTIVSCGSDRATQERVVTAAAIPCVTGGKLKCPYDLALLDESRARILFREMFSGEEHGNV